MPKVKKAQKANASGKHDNTSQCVKMLCGTEYPALHPHNSEPITTARKLYEPWVRRFAGIHTQLLSKFSGRSRLTRNYKNAVSGKFTPDDRAFKLFLALFRNETIHSATDSIFQGLINSLHVLAYNLVLETHSQGTASLENLRAAIAECQQLIVPYRLPIVVDASFEPMASSTSICSRMELNALAHFIAICAPDEVYNLIYAPTLRMEDCEGRRAVVLARSNQEFIAKKISPFIPKQFRKRAERACIETMAAFYEWSVDYLLGHQWGVSLLSVPSGNKENPPFSAVAHEFLRTLSATPNMNNGFPMAATTSTLPSMSAPSHAVELDLAELLDKASQRYDLETMREVFGEWVKAPELVLSGFYLLVAKEPMWAQNRLAMLLTSEIANISILRFHIKANTYAASGSHNKEVEARAKRYSEIVQPIYNMLTYPQDELRCATGDGQTSAVGNYAQLMKLSRFIFLDNELPPIQAALNERIPRWLAVVGELPDSVVGALTAIYLLDSTGILLGAPKKPDDREKLLELVRMTDENAAALQKRNRELEAALSTKTKQIERQDAGVLDLTRQLAAKEKELSALNDEKQDIQQQMDELMEVMEQMSREEEAGDWDENNDELIIPNDFHALRVVSCGGTDRFAAEIQAMLPGVFVYDCKRTPPANVLRLADIVFVQVKCISHADYYTIRDICKANKTPIYSYPTSGAKKAAQFILNTTKGLPSQL